MDRTEELVRATQLFQSIDRSKTTQRSQEPSSFFVKSNRVSAELEQNAKLVQKMHTLTERKEFSNDPIVEMKKISTTFQENITNIERELSHLKKDTAAGNGSSEGGSAAQHRKLVLEYLEKTMRRYVGSFKDAVKVYAANVEQRNKRVGSKYGQSGGLSSLTSENASKYAMFSATLPEPLVSVSTGSELRQRRGNAPSSSTADAAFVVSSTDEGANSEEAPLLGSVGDSAAAAADAYESRKKYGKGGAVPHPSATPTGSAAWAGTSSSSSNSGASGGLYNRGKGDGAAAGGRSGFFGVGGGAGMQQQAQVQKGRGRELDRHRLQQAEQAESTIAQMGQLFAQMATLVSEQSEVVQRIEDDVEAGLHETLEAQGHLERVYEITKGNRGLILKVFALLVFFIFLFLVWT